jgi:hypothetical protein
VSGKPVLLRVEYDAGRGGIDATMRQAGAAIADNISFALGQSGDRHFNRNANIRVR